MGSPLTQGTPSKIYVGISDSADWTIGLPLLSCVRGFSAIIRCSTGLVLYLGSWHSVCVHMRWRSRYLKLGNVTSQIPSYCEILGCATVLQATLTVKH